MSLGLAISAGIFCLILLLLAQTIEKQHALFKLLIYGFVVISLVLVGKGAIESTTVCDFLVANQTVTGNTTSFEYATQCYTSTSNSNASNLYTLSISFLGIFLFYTMMFYFKVVMEKLAEILRFKK